MKTYVISISIVALALIACNPQQKTISDTGQAKVVENDTVRIANDSLEYEVTIIDAGFSSWLASRAQPRKFYSQSYLEGRNVIWVAEWNIRARNPLRYNNDLYEMAIDYRPGIDYGYEVNYLLYNYLVYFQLTNNQRLGGFAPRI